ncbi:NAD(+) diphosphatase [Marinovum sp. 2_MG-2023]|uniref:NAD(+) diphosphatase n=1 Tax=unclassified Marinovum TaxID=2647166 RepID=UPI0026E3C783|nr:MULTISPECIES: NAD(+) diphosphatase [unclassified Marinovum]MDO6728389.1 NAD(+) diphosphatase [Marinovum sp. 2_MG-2023]MDO6778195.1 NAD(+) diphosphatase [Marinovum sp. 1_MG-2023]
MKLAETVTFGGSALDRMAEIRGDQAALTAARQDANARAILLWRGKVLVNGESQLVRLPLDHPILTEASPETILLGRDTGAAVFAYDLSHWEPDQLDAGQLGQFLDQSIQTHPALPDGEGFAELRAIMAMMTPRDAELAATAKAVFGWHESHRFCSRCGAQSDMSQAGWQRSCPACGGQHFPRTDPVVIMLITHGNSVLMGRSPAWPEGMYSLLAGFVEPGETLEAAVRREVMEESNVPVGAVEYLASQPWPFPASLMFGCRGEALATEITIDPVELEHACWVSREEMAEVFAGQHPVMKPARKGAIAHFLLLNWLADRLD